MEPLFAMIDRVAAGRQAGVVAPPEAVSDPRTRRVFAWVLALLVVLGALGIATLVAAQWLASRGEGPGPIAWMRGVVALAISLTLFYFWFRARRGIVWAWARLALFSKIFPFVTLVMAAVPHLYPVWMETEQIVFAMVLMVQAWLLDNRHMRAVFVPASASDEVPTGA